MQPNAFISICIPAYKRIEPLQRLLDSIVIQRYRDFEVIVTDDSPDKRIGELCQQYQDRLAIYYFHNPTPLGTPENWNESIRKAKGDWIKLMHDDDWFVQENSLTEFAAAVKLNPGSSFIYSAYINVPVSGQLQEMYPDSFRLRQLNREPASLFARNIIGPPSCVLFRKRKELIFDKSFKWVVDFDFYIRYLNETKAIFIPMALVNIGISETQVTRESFHNPSVEIPENFRLLAKVGTNKLENIFIYDAFWRLIRNLKIRHIDQVRAAGFSEAVPAKIRSMIKFQNWLPGRIIQIGAVSKLLMVLCFSITYFNKDAHKP